MNVHSFMLTSIVTAFVMTCIHYAVMFAVRSRSRDVGHAVGIDRRLLRYRPLPVADIRGGKFRVIEGDFMREDLPSDYKNSVLPEQEEVHAAWVERARGEAKRLAAARGTITSDDLWDECPPPSGVDSRIMGSVFYPREMWMHVGYAKSRRKVNHGRSVSVWRLREAA